MKITFTVLGNLPRKSNSRQIVKNRRTGHPMLIKSNNALCYERDFKMQTMRVPKGQFKEKEPLILYADIYYQSKRPDLSDELLDDLMEKTGIIHNDRQIIEKHLGKFIDPENPRVVVCIESQEEVGVLQDETFGG